MVALFRSHPSATDSDASPRIRLQSLRREALRHEREDRAERGFATPEPKPPTRLRRFAERWIPETWLESRVDPGRAGLLALALVGIMGVVIAVLTVWADRPSPEPAEPVRPPVLANPAPSTSSREFVVSVVGRVARPGLVTVAPGDRVADAIEAAGGALPDTDLIKINLARRLVDGEQLYVAIPGPPEVAPAPVDDRSAGSKLDLNTATEAQLDELPGIGKVTAQRIVQWRTEHGRFASVEQLREVGGIGDARLSRLRELVRV